jgi:aspartate-semialdehyde dehydrogenase
MSEGWNIAILGATGAVGEALLETLAERQFPVGEIYALARTDSAGEHLRFGGKSVMVQDAAAFDWTQAQLAFFAAGAEATASYIEEATNSGCLVIDLSGLFSLEPDVPLVVPDVNPFVLADYRNRNIIAVPNSLTSQLLTALKPLIDDGGLSRISVTSLLSASANGKKAVEALAGQSAKLLNGIPIDEDDFFGRQLAFNMLPLLPDREGSVREERRIVDEARKILQDDGLMISANVVQSPVFYGHAQMVGFEALRPLAAEEARDAFGRGEDIVLSEESEFPTQVGDATGSAHLSVGCVRNDYGMPEQVQFWSVADNVRFGGALMAVKIADKLVQEYLYCGQMWNKSRSTELPSALSTMAVNTMAGSGRMRCAASRRSWRKRSLRLRMNRSTSSARAAPMPGFTARGRWCILTPPPCVRTRPGRWV